MKVQERRKEKRETLCIDVAVDISRNQKWYDLKCIDISKSGMCLKTDIVMPVETPVELEFCLPRFGTQIEVEGHVVCREYSAEEDYFYYGIMFINLLRKYKEIIGKFIETTDFHS
ncbi:MAG: PilZ domain-containing protein [Spirochaetales bacterium]|nr:PilZ domain-containing protein [Spirochaetales bacterium]